MTELIKGKKYYCSDVSLEKAEEHKREKEKELLYYFDGEKLHCVAYKEIVNPDFWEYKILADDNEEEQNKMNIGDKVYVSDFSEDKAVEDGDIHEFRGIVDGYYVCVRNACYDSWKYAVVVHPKKTVVKKASEIVKWLEDNGYKADVEGNWFGSHSKPFNRSMFQFCGKEPSDSYSWLPEWLEEI